MLIQKNVLKLNLFSQFLITTHAQSVECYDADTDTWSEVASMNYNRSSFAAVVVDQYIFVLGGLNTTTVERFDTRTSRWELMPAMNMKRLNFGAAQVCGFIYVVGKQHAFCL